MNIFKNDKRLPKRFFVRHIKEGLVRYTDDGKDVIYLITNAALQKMNKSFEGRPLYINHVDKVDMETVKMDKVGDVIKSFYNEFDGAWWAEILADEEGQSVIDKGWVVSNAYVPTELGLGGDLHNVHYSKEIKNGRYDHMALTDNPRYEEAVVMTPDEFKSYNEGRKQELEQLKNSKENTMLSEEDKKALVASLASELMPMLRNAMDEKFEEVKKNAEERDHRELIREIAAVSAKSEDDFEGGMQEKVRTIIGLAERLGYSKDEAGKNAKKNEDDNPAPKGDEKASHEREGELVNKCHNKDEDKEEDKKEDMKKNSNFFSALKNAKRNVEEKYISTMASGLKLGRDRYGKK